MIETSVIRLNRPLTCQTHKEWPQPIKYRRHTLELTDVTDPQETLDALGIVKQRPDIDSLIFDVSLYEETLFSVALTDLLSSTDRTWSLVLTFDPSVVLRLVQIPEFIAGLHSIQSVKHLTLRSITRYVEAMSKYMPLIRSLPVFRQLETFCVCAFHLEPQYLDEVCSFPFADHLSGKICHQIASFLSGGFTISNATLQNFRIINLDWEKYLLQSAVPLTLAIVQLPMLQKLYFDLPWNFSPYTASLQILFDWMKGDQCRLTDLVITENISRSRDTFCYDAFFEISTLKTLELVQFKSEALSILQDPMQKRHGNIHFKHLVLKDCVYGTAPARQLMMSFPTRVTLAHTCVSESHCLACIPFVTLFEIMWGFQSSAVYSIGSSLWPPLLQNLGRFVNYEHSSPAAFDYPKKLALDAIFTVLCGILNEPPDTWMLKSSRVKKRKHSMEM